MRRLYYLITHFDFHFYCILNSWNVHFIFVPVLFVTTGANQCCVGLLYKVRDWNQCYLKVPILVPHWYQNKLIRDQPTLVHTIKQARELKLDASCLRQGC